MNSYTYHERRAVLEDLSFADAGGRVVRTPAWTDIDGAAVFDVVRGMALSADIHRRFEPPADE